MKLKEVYEHCRNTRNLIDFMKDLGLLQPTPVCPACHQSMKFEKDSSSLNGYIYVCRVRTNSNRHKCKSMITKGSFFEDSRLPLEKIFSMMYFWGAECSVKQVKMFTGLSKKTIIQWFQYFRDIVSHKLVSEPLLFGGENKRVQIDESKFMKLLHHRGEPRGNTRDGWVFGIFDEDSKNVHFEFVMDRTQQTIFPIIARVVLPGTTIWSDEYATYTGGPNRNPEAPTPLSLLGPYIHKFVNHSRHFIDPVSGVHTNSIEGSWALCKRKFKYMFGTRSSFIPSYLDEFMWRRRFCTDNDAFEKLMLHISEKYVFVR